MKLPENIEKEIREYARKRGYSEVEYIHYREFVINLAQVLKDTLPEIQKINKAA